MKHFCKEESCQVKKVFVDCQKQIQSHCMYKPCTSGTKLAILIAYFIEQSDSFPLHIIFEFFKRNKTRATVCCLLYELNIFFSALRLDT